MTKIVRAYTNYMMKRAVIERYLPPIIPPHRESAAADVTQYSLGGGAVGTGLGVLKMMATGNPLQIPMGFLTGATTGAGLELTDRYRKKIGKMIASEAKRKKYTEAIGGAALGTGVGLLSGLLAAPFVGPIAIPAYVLGDALIGTIGSRNIVNFVDDVARYIKRTGGSIEDYLFEKTRKRPSKKKKGR